MKGIAVWVQSADYHYLFVLIPSGPLLIIKLISRIVSSFEDVLFTLPNDNAYDSLWRGLGLGVRIRRLSRLLIGSWFGFGLG